MTTNLEELKRAAEAATRQGAIKAPHTTKSRKARDDFAALARPSTILSLLAAGVSSTISIHKTPQDAFAARAHFQSQEASDVR